MERQTMMFNKFSLSCEVLKYLTYADTAISFLHRLCCQSREMILKNWQLITKLVEKREITLCDRAQFDRLIDTKIILFKLAIIFGYNGTLTIKDLNHFADKLVVLFKQNTQNLINSGTQGVTEEDYLKYYSAEISSISKTEDSDIRYKTSFEYINLKYMETIISLERIDRNLLNCFLGKVKFYSYIGNLSDISSYVKPLLQSHQQIIDEYKSEKYDQFIDYRLYSINPEIFQDFCSNYENKEFGMYLRICTTSSQSYNINFIDNITIGPNEAKLLRSNENFTSKRLQHLSIYRFIDEGFLETLLLDQDLPKFKEIVRFQLSRPRCDVLLKFLSLLTKDNIHKLNYSFPRLKTIGFNLYHFYDEFEENVLGFTGKLEMKLRCINSYLIKSVQSNLSQSENHNSFVTHILNSNEINSYQITFKGDVDFMFQYISFRDDPYCLLATQINNLRINGEVLSIERYYDDNYHKL